MNALAFIARQVSFDEVTALDRLVGFVSHILALFVLDGRIEGFIRVGAIGFVIIRVCTEEDGQTLGRCEGIREAVLVRINVVGITRIGINAHFLTHVLAGLIVVDRTGNRDGVRVVTRYDQKRIGMFVDIFLSTFNHLIEGNRVADGARPVERVRELVDQAGFKHQEEAFLVLAEHFDGSIKRIRQVGLIRELLHRVALPLVAVNPAVHIAGMEESKELLRRLAVNGGKQFGTVRDELVAVLLEEFKIVG